MQGNNGNQPYQNQGNFWPQQGPMADQQYPFPQQDMYQPQYQPVQPQMMGQQMPQYPDMFQQTMSYQPVNPQMMGQQAPPAQPYQDMFQQTMQYTPVRPQQYQYQDVYQQTMQYTPVQAQQYQYQDVYQQPTMQYTPVNPQQMQQMQPSPMHPNMFNQQGKQKRKKKPKGPKRPGPSPLKTALISALIVAMIGGGAYLLWTQAQNRQNTTATVEASTVGTSYRGDALIVRNEVAFDEEGVQNIEYIAQEGSTVYRNNVLCHVYSTGYSISEMRTLQDYRDQIRDFELSLLGSETSFDQKMERLESETISRGLEVRSLVQGARGNMIQQEQILDTAIEQRQSYFRSKYSEEPRLSRLFDDEDTQKQRIESWIKQKSANQESIVSFYTDGFEYALSPSNYESYTPTQVRNMINGQKPEESLANRGRTTLYRLVKKQDYVVLMLVKDSTWTPKDGDTYKLVLEQFSSTVVNAKVLSSTRTGGELLVRLAVMGDVTDVLYMRTCSAELGKHVDCMKVPVAALYTQNGNTGVVIDSADGQFFIPVNVMEQSGGYAYITAIQTGQLTSGMTVRLFH